MIGTLIVRNLPGVIASLSAFEQKVDEAYDDGLSNCATILRNETRAQLQRPGTGKQYPSRVGATARRQIAAVEEAKARYAASQTAGDRSALLTANRRLRGSQKRLRKTLGRLGRSTAGGTHRASAPGEPPAPDVGLLPQAVKAGRLGDTIVVGVGGEWRGWLALHEGRGRIRGDRPFFRLAIDRVKGKLPRVLAATIRERGVFRG